LSLRIIKILFREAKNLLLNIFSKLLIGERLSSSYAIIPRGSTPPRNLLSLKNISVKKGEDPSSSLTLRINSGLRLRK
jgi:hypothetical protein